MHIAARASVASFECIAGMGECIESGLMAALLHSAYSSRASRIILRIIRNTPGLISAPPLTCDYTVGGRFYAVFRSDNIYYVK